ncbi:LOW QUALITY PROTEIN: G-protein coupled receptor dmsr-1-like [Dermacentor silvarum]|uniref:LOW QUALITY PROTEIN: G-protein coupled receptor dmsr-1-like n=1 Tax=Dermacentor silvarum TaxID=543639 RepID=UPI0021011DF0|nr:LOW QUALITY PROTEIN: G-protein coupled receptor dmsr-1-like [Dermacentor silvarum]
MAEVLNVSSMLQIADSLYLDEENLSLTETNLSGPFAGFDVFEEEELPYHGAELGRFHTWYTSHLHGYLSMTVCVFGILANVLNIIVLTQRNMVSPTNGILTGLAVADMLVIATYLPYTITTHVMPPARTQSFGTAVFILVHAHVSVVFHTVSTWLTVTLAVWRFLAVSFPASSKEWCSMQRARWAVVSVYVSCALCCLPVYLSFTVHQEGTPQEPSYKVDFSNITAANGAFLQNLNFWTYSVLMKLVPCVALTGLSLGLLRVLYEAKARKRRLRRGASGHSGHGGGSEEARDRTTRMLLAVLLLFLVTEFPSGIAALLSGILGDDFFLHVYMNFGEVMDILALVNSAVNFILYCSMSRQFRKAFAALFTPRIVAKWFPLTSEPPNSTYATTCV